LPEAINYIMEELREFTIKNYRGFIRVNVDWITNEPLYFVLND